MVEAASSRWKVALTRPPRTSRYTSPSKEAAVAEGACAAHHEPTTEAELARLSVDEARVGLGEPGHAHGCAGGLALNVARFHREGVARDGENAVPLLHDDRGGGGAGIALAHEVDVEVLLAVALAGLLGVEHGQLHRRPVALHEGALPELDGLLGRALCLPHVALEHLRYLLGLVRSGCRTFAIGVAGILSDALGGRRRFVLCALLDRVRDRAADRRRADDDGHHADGRREHHLVLLLHSLSLSIGIGWRT